MTRTPDEFPTAPSTGPSTAPSIETSRASELADARERRRHAERTAVTLLGIAALVMAIICGGIIVSGWFAGVMEDHAERWFWAGSILELLMVFVFAAAAFPGGSDDRRVIRRVTALIRIGLVMFVAAPVMVLGSMVFDFYG